MPVEHKSIQDVVNKNNHKALQRRLMILMKSGTGRFAHLLHEHLSIVNKSSRSGDLRICKFGWMIKFRSCFCPPSLHFSQVLIFYTRCFWNLNVWSSLVSFHFLFGIISFYCIMYCTHTEYESMNEQSIHVDGWWTAADSNSLRHAEMTDRSTGSSCFAFISGWLMSCLLLHATAWYGRMEMFNKLVNLSREYLRRMRIMWRMGWIWSFICVQLDSTCHKVIMIFAATTSYYYSQYLH